jgi:hypothetical protein
MDFSIINFGNDIATIKRNIKPNFEIIKSKRFVNACLDEIINSIQRNIEHRNQRINSNKEYIDSTREIIKKVETNRQRQKEVYRAYYENNNISKEVFDNLDTESWDFSDNLVHIENTVAEVNKLEIANKNATKNLNDLRLINACIYCEGEGFKLDNYRLVIDTIETWLTDTSLSGFSIIQLIFVELIFSFQTNKEPHETVFLTFKRLLDKFGSLEEIHPQKLNDLINKYVIPQEHTSHLDYYFWLIIALRQTDELDLEERLDNLNIKNKRGIRAVKTSAKKYRNLLNETQLELITEWCDETLETLKNHIDTRIKGVLSETKVKAYFMQLVDFEYKKGKFIKVLTEEQVNHILCANFVGFPKITTIEKYDIPKDVEQLHIRKFVYDFYKKHKEKNRTDKYISILKNHFSLFDGTEFSSLKTNFSR